MQSQPRAPEPPCCTARAFFRAAVGLLEQGAVAASAQESDTGVGTGQYAERNTGASRPYAALGSNSGPVIQLVQALGWWARLEMFLGCAGLPKWLASWLLLVMCGEPAYCSSWFARFNSLLRSPESRTFLAMPYSLAKRLHVSKHGQADRSALKQPFPWFMLAIAEYTSLEAWPPQVSQDKSAALFDKCFTHAVPGSRAIRQYRDIACFARWPPCRASLRIPEWSAGWSNCHRRSMHDLAGQSAMQFRDEQGIPLAGTIHLRGGCGGGLCKYLASTLRASLLEAD